MECKYRNCNSCTYFPCDYYNQFNIDRNIGCMNWSDKIDHTYVSSGTNCEKANSTVDTQYEIVKPIVFDKATAIYVLEKVADAVNDTLNDRTKGKYDEDGNLVGSTTKNYLEMFATLNNKLQDILNEIKGE